jgi:hypothetical protein
MTTLADINQTLQQQVELMIQQGKNIDKTSKGIDSVKNKIAQVLTDQKQDRLDTLEEKKEKKAESQKLAARPSGLISGLAQGTGLSWLGGFISSMFGSMFGAGSKLLGLLTGAIGLAAGKLLVWTAIGTLIATFFGDELKAVAEKFKEYTGIDLVKALDENPGIELAITALAGALTLGVTKALARLGARALGGLAGIGMGMLGFGKTPAETKMPTRPGQQTSGQKTTAKTAKKPVVRPGQATSGILKGKPLPAGYAYNKAGQIVQQGTNRFASVDEVIEAISKSGKAAKYGNLLKFLGGAATIGLSVMEPAMAIYSGAPEDEIRKQVVGALGSIGGAYLGAALGAAGITAVPVVGQSGVANIAAGLVGGIIGSVAGEWMIEELADFLMGTNSNTKPLPGMEGGAPNRATAYKMNMEKKSPDAIERYLTSLSSSGSALDPIAQQGQINAFNEYGFDRDRQRTRPTERGLLPTTPTTGQTLTNNRVTNTQSNTIMTNNGNAVTTTTTTNQSVVNYGNASHNPYDGSRTNSAYGYGIR